jgi:hypothetical protein
MGGKVAAAALSGWVVWAIAVGASNKAPSKQVNLMDRLVGFGHLDAPARPRFNLVGLFLDITRKKHLVPAPANHLNGSFTWASMGGQ